MMPAIHPYLLYAILLVLAAIIFGVDIVSRLGVSTWVFYQIPIVLTVLQRRESLPVLMGLLAIVLVIAGFYLSPTGADEEFATINRAIGIVAAIMVTFLASRVIAARKRAEQLLRIEQGRTEVARSVMGDKNVPAVARDALESVIDITGAQVGLLYVLQQQRLVPLASFAVDPVPDQSASLAAGQGLPGEVMRARRSIVVSDLPPGHLQIRSGTGRSAPAHLLLAPITADGEFFGVIELGFTRRPAGFDVETRLLDLAAEKIGVGIRSAQYRDNLRILLEQTQQQSEELQAQTEELRVVNEEMQEQSRALQHSQAQLETQQSELEQVNSELEERTIVLEQQRRDLIDVQERLQANAEELERANRYKSEFLANMSHELRTPLNSSLILSHMLMQNKPGTLTAEQVRYAGTIHAANNDLLNLINDILDLSRIEAGSLQAEPETVTLDSIVESVHETFDPVASNKSLQFRVSVAAGMPDHIITDDMRLKQVLRNLLSNAFKFTDKGEVSLQISRSRGDRIAFAVEDTGIGIPAHQQQVIFEAFRQADGSTSRTYGGTGLGLSISRQLAHLLGGEIEVASEPGKGSRFTLVVPRHLAVPVAPAASAPATASSQTREPMPAEHHQPAGQAGSEGAAGNGERPSLPAGSAPAAPARLDSPREPGAPAIEPPSIEDDRRRRRRERLIMAVEDDEKFAMVLHDLAHETGFDFIHAPSAAAAERLGREYAPDAILLDVRLPDRSGLSVLEWLKRDPDMRHIPVHLISVDDYRKRALELGAVGYHLKPVAHDEIVQAIQKLQDILTRDVKRLLIVEDNEDMRNALVSMIGHDGIDTVTAGTAAEALRHLQESTFDCVILDLKLPDGSGYEVLEQMSHGGKYGFPPVIIYTGRELSADEEHRLRRYSESIIVKGARSPERLLDEVSLFLHRVESHLPPQQRMMLTHARQRDAVFEGRKILLAEDDVRNVFALSSIFEPLGAQLEIARNGSEALERVRNADDISLVLMDIMMPVMDGLTAIRAIRALPDRRDLPIIALTAKAMPNDRTECLQAGANDYIAKPLDVDQLVSLCRVWIHR